MIKPVLFSALTFAVVVATSPAWACACCGTWAVTNVAEDDSLNIRNGPGVRFSIVGTIPANSGCVIRTGRCKRRWCPVSYGGTSGWVNARYLRYLK